MKSDTTSNAMLTGLSLATASIMPISSYWHKDRQTECYQKTGSVFQFCYYTCDKGALTFVMFITSFTKAAASLGSYLQGPSCKHIRVNIFHLSAIMVYNQIETTTLIWFFMWFEIKGVKKCNILNQTAGFFLSFLGKLEYTHSKYREIFIMKWYAAITTT